MDYHLCGPLTPHLRDCQFQNDEVEMAFHEWLCMQEPDFYDDKFFKLVPRWNKCINVLGEYGEK
jgi:hypothetical protein